MTLEDGKLVGSNEHLQNFADSQVRQGVSPEEFIQKFSNSTNGYLVVKVVAE